MRKRGLGEARRLFRARKFAEVIRTLEPEVFRHRESAEYFSLLGLSCLHTGELGGALSYLNRARQLKPEDMTSLLGVAAIHFRRAETERALKIWLEALEIQQSNAVARRGMNLLRRGLAPDAIQHMVDSGRIRALYPPLPLRRSALSVLGIVLSVCALCGLGYVAYQALSTRLPRQERPGISAVEIPPEVLAVATGETGQRYTLTEREVRAAFAKAKDHLLDFRDNMALLQINRLLLSNASLPVKERARVLKGFAAQPSFDTLRDPFPYATVKKEPELYDGCYVDWKGKTANLATRTEGVSFDLLVGYHLETELEGIVPVALAFPVVLENGIPLEVLGQVVSAGGVISLLGVSVHRLSVP